MYCRTTHNVHKQHVRILLHMLLKLKIQVHYLQISMQHQFQKITRKNTPSDEDLSIYTGSKKTHDLRTSTTLKQIKTTQKANSNNFRCCRGLVIALYEALVNRPTNNQIAWY